jgi:hypothetical protein
MGIGGGQNGEGAAGLKALVGHLLVRMLMGEGGNDAHLSIAPAG